MTPSPVHTRKQEPHVEVQNPAHGSCAKDTTPQPSGFNPSPSSHAPNMPAPRPHPEARGTGEASSTSEADFGFPTKMPDNEVSSCCLLQSPHHPPGTVGAPKTTCLWSSQPNHKAGPGDPMFQVKKLRQRKRRGIRVTSLVSGSSGQCLLLDKGHHQLSLSGNGCSQSPLQGLRRYSHRAVGHYDGCEVGRVHAPPRVTLGNP